MKNQLILMATALLTFSTARADDSFVLYNFKKSAQPRVEVSPPPELTLQSIRETARAMHIWNPTTDENELQNALFKRVKFMGVNDGLIKPEIVLMDAAVLAGKPEVARYLMPSIARQFPAAAQKIAPLLGLDPFQLRPVDLTGFRDDAVAMINKHGGLASGILRPGSALANDWNKIDPTGISAVIYGPGSYIMDASIDGDMPDDARSPVLGISRDDVASCRERCVGPALHGAAVGTVVGTVMGGVLGPVIGLAVQGPKGIVRGSEIGTNLGQSAGASVGSAIGWGICSSNCSNDPKPAPSAPTPSNTDGGTNTPAPSTAPSAPPSTPPSPAPSGPPPTTTPATNDNDGGPSNTPPASDGNAGTPSSGGGENCHPGDESCGRTIHDSDPSNDHGEDGLHHIVHNIYPDLMRQLRMQKMAPVINPVRGFDVGRFARGLK